ncbi:MAG: Recombinase [Candidatus Uhrbacteria bacterium GW2011_GWF2_41_16]|uniref:Recombinase n=1 Tax=Candidatus Uhrbacteria bacterium GW2011_GWF2_41_16 TaxID=1618997 RepID=A0A0G0XPS4_9BACT|nr:MAG: Recombinase [Candidatus Uhrbacteria bacterium GW2011_GWF2_41_16]
MLKKAVMYVRVSSKEQAEQGFSPEAQRVCLYNFARSNSFDVVKEFEEAETAKDSRRKEFAAMLEYVKTKDIKNILVEKTDRLHRNFTDYVAIDELVEKYGVTVWLVKEGNSIGKDSRASDKLMHGLKTVLAKGFIDNLKEEVRKGFDVKISYGEYPHQAPLGYLNTKDPHNPKHNIVTPDPVNSKLIIKMFEYYATGIYSMKSLIAKLEDDGLTLNLPPFLKSGKLYISTVQRCLTSPFYIGKFQWNGKMINGTYDPIIKPELWAKVQDVINGRSINLRKEHNVMPFTYKGMFTCGECGRSVTAEKKKGRYVYYHCTQYKTECKQPWVKEEKIENRFEKITKLLKISDKGVAFVSLALKQSLSEKRRGQDKAFEALIAEQTRIKQRMDTMYEDRLDHKISETDYDRHFSDYTKQLENLEERIGKHNRADISYYDFGHRILELAENAERLAKLATPEEKRELTQFLLSNSKITDGEPIFSLKLPYSAIEKRSPCDDRSSWQGR